MLKSRQTHSKSIAIFVLCLLILFLFLCNPDISLDSARRGLSICSGILIPTLFPYMVISELIIRSAPRYYIGKVFQKPMSLLFGISGGGAVAIVLGLLCGFPIGAKTAGALYSNGDITKKEYENLLGLCNYPSAPFVIFAIGKNLLGNVNLGIFIYVINVITGLSIGFLTRKKSGSSETRQILQKKPNDLPFSKAFTESVSSSANSMIVICALVTFFTAAVGCISSIGFIANDPILQAVLLSFFELSSGTAACASLTSRYLAAVLSAAAVGWSGLSVLLQIYSTCITEKNAPSLGPYIFSRILSAVICSVSTATALRFFPALLPEKIPDTDVFLTFPTLPYTYLNAVNILFLSSVLFYFNKKLDRRQMI